MGKSKRTQAPEFINTLLEIGIKHLVASGLSAEQSKVLMSKISQELCNTYQRQLIYIPRGTSFRNEDIWLKFNGNNQLELAKEFNLSEVMIYKIIEEQRVIQRRKNQISFPGFEEA